MPNVFLSYSREDQATARRFAEAFQQAGLSVWWDQTLTAGESYDEVTEQALKSARAVVVLWSQSSVSSRWVRAEATIADRNETLVPVMIEPCERPVMFELRQSEDLSEWAGDVKDPRWQSFLAGVKRVVNRDRSAAAEKAPVVLSGAPTPVSTRDPFRRVRSMLIAASVLIVALAGLWLFLRLQDKAAPETVAAAPAVSATARELSIAVLPFVNMSSDPEQEFFSDGLSEELLNQLAQIPELSVIGRTSSFSFKGRNEDLRVIGAELGASHLLEGSVRKAGNRVKITAQLINAADGVHLWSETYERTLDDIFAIQDEIAREVASQLELKLGARPFRDSGTRKVAAFEALLTGRGLLRFPNRQSMVAAVPHLERAVELDPEYVTAWLWLADAYTRLAFDPEMASQAYRRQDAVIDKVVRIAPGSPEASLAMSYRATRGRDLTELERLLREGLQVPGELGLRARLRLAQFLISTGQSEQGLAEMLKVRQSDPLDAFVQSQIPGFYYASGDRARGDQELQRLRELEGGETSTALGIELVDAMNRDDGSEVARINRALAEKSGSPVTPFEDALPGDPRRAVEILRGRFEEQRESGDASSLTRSLTWFEYLGDRDLALQAATSFANSTFNIETLTGGIWREVLGGLRSDPRFKDVYRRLGLVDYWRATGNWGDFCKPVGTDDFECR